MEDSGAILCQISSLKDMLDQVNDEIEANIQITREIESEIVKCSEIETALALRESELTKTLYVSHFEINGFAIVTANSRASLNCLEKELCFARMKRDEMLRRVNDKWEGFTTLCLEFQRDIDIGKNDELRALLSEKDLLENEIHLLDKKNNALKNSMLAFVEEILEDLHKSNSALQVEIQTGNQENEKLLKDIDDLQKLFLSAVMADDDHWFTIIVIDIILYHARPLNIANANKGLPYEGSSIKCYCTQIDCRLKTLDELKMIVMEELCVNNAMHNIQITYRSSHEVLKHRINYKYMAIEADKHVKIMFDKMERITQVSVIELYIKLEPGADVGVEEIQQATTSLQVTVPNA
ncbi:hypothetical protein SO802_021103 [Lithocarpus litseifolius]|uniref:Uncharacterized protein n=1 Tax=Lithocarpus litseifolius TaxID=425828 RepID=A0AAW2CEA0_9ROSI